MEELPNQKHMVVEEWDYCDMIDSMGLGFALGNVVIRVHKVMIAVITLFEFPFSWWHNSKENKTVGINTKVCIIDHVLNH